MAEEVKGGPNQPQSARKEPSRFAGKVCVEVVEERNRPVLWPPDQRQLRSRWQKSNLNGDEMVEPLNVLGDIPGVCIEADGNARRLRIFDLLALPENEEMARVAFKVKKEHFRSEEGPLRDVLIEDASDGQIKTWLYWMRRMVEGRPLDDAERNGVRRPALVSGDRAPQAIVRSGTLPKLDEIARLPGECRVGFFDSSTRGFKSVEQMERSVRQ